MDIITLVQSKLCIADMEDFEDVVGKPLLEAIDSMEEGTAKIDLKVLTGLIWIARRHEDSAFTFEQARYLPITTLTLDKRENPTKAAPKKSGSKKPALQRRPALKR